MKINSINNNNQSFMALKNIKYIPPFDPSKNSDHAKIVRAFLDNKSVKSFCEKFDVEAVFDEVIFECNSKLYNGLTMNCKEIGVKKTKNVFEKFKSLFKKDDEEGFKIYFMGQKTGSKPLLAQMESITDERLDKELLRYKKSLTNKANNDC